MLDLILDVDFFRGKNSTTRHLYFLYTVIAGMYYETYIRRWFRYSLIIWYVFDFIVMWICWYRSMMTVQTYHIGWLAVMVTQLSFSCGSVITTVRIYSKRKSIRIAFQAIETAVDRWHVESDFMKYLPYWYYLSFILVFGGFVGKLILRLFTMQSSSEIQYMDDYVYPFPFISSPTTFQYVLIFISETLFLLPSSYSFSHFLTINSVISVFLKNQIDLLKRDIKMESDSTTKIIERSYEREFNIMIDDPFDKIPKLSGISTKRDEIYCRFVDKTKAWMKRYQEIIYITRHLKGFIQTVLSMNIAMMMPMLLMIVHIAVTQKTENFTYCFYAVELIPLLLITCIIGNVCLDMNNEIAQEVNAMPWYWLPPKERKTIFNFLCLVRTPHPVVFFNVCPISLHMFPRILSKFYSYFQMMRKL